MITAENAKELQQLSVQARHVAKLATQQPKPEPAIAQKPVQIADSFTAGSLTRVRKQLDLMMKALAGAIAGTTVQADKKGNLHVIDPGGIDRLSSAVWRLSEMERKYAGRPDPGSFRPQSDKSSRQRNRPVEVWADETPPQVVPGVPVQQPVQPSSTPPVHGPENG